MRTVHEIGMYAFVGVIAIATMEVRADEPGGGAKKPLEFHVDVIEWTSAGYYGDDLNDRGQAALTGPSSAVRFGNLARRWDSREGFLTIGPEHSTTTGINNRGDVSVVLMGEFATPWRSALWTERDGLTDIGTLGGARAFADAVNDRGEVV